MKKSFRLIQFILVAITFSGLSGCWAAYQTRVTYQIPSSQCSSRCIDQWNQCLKLTKNKYPYCQIKKTTRKGKFLFQHELFPNDWKKGFRNCGPESVGDDMSCGNPNYGNCDSIFTSCITACGGSYRTEKKAVCIKGWE